MSSTSSPLGPQRPAMRRKLAIAFVCVGAVTGVGVLAMQLVGMEQWKNVVLSTGAATPVFFNDTSLVRMSEGRAERVSEGARTPLPLEGKPRIFARGPSNTIAFQSEREPFNFQSIGSDATLTETAPLPAVKHVVTGVEQGELGTPILIVSTSGVATLWSTRSSHLDRGPQLVKSLMNMKVARFDERSEHLYVSYLDGGSERFELASGTPTLALPARGMVKAIGATGDSVLVADDKGVRWFDEGSTKVRANLLLPNVVALEYGHHPSSSAPTDQRWLALTTDGNEHMLRVISPENGGRELHRLPIPLPPSERPVALTTTEREILVATDKGGVWQLALH